MINALLFPPFLRSSANVVLPGLSHERGSFSEDDLYICLWMVSSSEISWSIARMTSPTMESDPLYILPRTLRAAPCWPFLNSHLGVSGRKRNKPN